MDITSFSCPSKDAILQNTMNKLESIWDEISYPKGTISGKGIRLQMRGK